MLKRLVNISLVLVMLVSSAFIVSADSTADTSALVADISWQVDKDGVLTISGSGEMPDYTADVPAPWYQVRSDVYSIVIGDGITAVGDYAFYNFAYARNVILPDGVLSIGDNSFAGCTWLHNVQFPESMRSIGVRAFYTCHMLTKLSIPKNVSNIGMLAFSVCNNLERLDVSEDNPTYLSLDGVVFSKDKSTLMLYPRNKPGAYYEVPDGVSVIANDAFYCANNLTKVTLPDTLVYINNSAFDGCYYLADINIPSRVRSIGEYAFSSTAITSLSLPASLRSVGNFAFESSNIKSISFQNGVNDISESAFSWCYDLTAINVSDNNNVYSSVDGVLFNKAKTRLIAYPAGKMDSEYVIPDGVESLGEYAFFESRTYELTVPESMTSFGYKTFNHSFVRYWYHLGTKSQWENIINVDTVGSADAYKGINLSDYEITYLANSGSEHLQATVMYDDTASNEFVWSSSDETVATVDSNGNVTYVGDGFAEIVVSTADGKYSERCLVSTGRRTAKGSFNDSVQWYIRDSVLTISGSGDIPDFEQKSQSFFRKYEGEFDTVVIEDGITGVGDYIFIDCDFVENITIADSVTKIGKIAFSGLGISELKLPENLVSIDDNAFEDCDYLEYMSPIPASVTYIGTGAFSGLSGLEAIEVADGNSAYTSVDGVLFTLDMTSLISYPAGKSDTDYYVPVGVEHIAEYAFEACSYLKSITMPDGLKTIETCAFVFNNSLAELTIPGSVTDIEFGAFRSNIYLVAVNVSPDNDYYCSVDGVLFSKDMKQLIVYPSGKKATGYVIPDTVNVIGDSAFYFCMNLQSVTLPAQLVSVGDWAFYMAENITDLVFPEGLETIGESAFESCYCITEVTFHKSLASIGEYAFSGTQLETVNYYGSVNNWHDMEIANYNYEIEDADINYYETAVTQVSLSASKLDIPAGTRHQLQAVVSPEKATNKDVLWVSSDEDIATVNQNGIVTAVKEGETTISVISYSGQRKAVCTVTVLSEPEITSVAATKADDGSLQVDVTYSNIPTDAKLYVAAYALSGKLVQLVSPVMQDSASQSLINTPDVVAVKAFVWSSDGIMPLAVSKTHTLN